MLSEGARRAKRGTDVVVALCETHQRPHTVSMLEGLEVIPRKVVRYRDTELTEMDLDAVLARKPQVALVDEMAHTNVPGSRNEKRWQDIEELLDAGIDVISTLNIQHLESLNDVVEAITGVVQQETVPDVVARAADQIELVDMSPQALRRRMAHGNIYRADSIDAALANYFRVGNLSALRELALLWLADRVEEGVGTYRDAHDIKGSWPTRERIVVALSGGREGEILLRRGARIASRSSGSELLAVHVARSDGLHDASEASLDTLRRLTSQLGGTFHTVTGEDAAEAVLDFSRGVNASQILIGSSRRKGLSSALRTSIGDAVVTGSGDIDVHVVNHPLAKLRVRPGRIQSMSTRRIVAGFVWAVLAPSLLTSGLHLVPDATGMLPLIVLLYLLLTVMAALLGGLGPAMFAAVFSSLTINWFFTPPLGTLTIANPQSALALVIFVVIGVSVSSVVHYAARRAVYATVARREAEALAELTQTLLASTDQLSLLLNRSLDLFGVQAAAVVSTSAPLSAPDVVLATDGFEPSLPIAAVEPLDEQHELLLLGPALPAQKQRLLSALAAHAAAILHRRGLQAQANAALALERDNKARTALLNAVSHDLRTPLAGIKAAIGSLRDTSVQFSEDDRRELLEAADFSADRLGTLIDNLLDMSRLEVGALVAHPRPTDLGELVPATIAATSDPDRITWKLGDKARYALADPVFIDRVLSNLLENALRHQPKPGRIHVVTSHLNDAVQVRVVDSGKGVLDGDKEAMFHYFQRFDDTSPGGVGLGLAVARGLTEAMDGALVAEDTPGGGLTMVVTVPAIGNTGP